MKNIVLSVNLLTLKNEICSVKSTKMALFQKVQIIYTLRLEQYKIFHPENFVKKNAHKMTQLRDRLTFDPCACTLTWNAHARSNSLLWKDASTARITPKQTRNCLSIFNKQTQEVSKSIFFFRNTIPVVKNVSSLPIIKSK